jgi:hypothetical protein
MFAQAINTSGQVASLGFHAYNGDAGDLSVIHVAYDDHVSLSPGLSRELGCHASAVSNRFFYVRKRDSRFIGIRIDFARPVRVGVSRG